MSDLAGLAGVSKITVSRALRNSPSVNPETRRKILELAKAHGYRLNLPARNLRLNRSHTLGVVVEMDPSRERPMSDPYPLELLGGISQELTSAGYSLLLTTAGAENIGLQAADGIILLGQGADDRAVHQLAWAAQPWIVWGAPKPGAAYPVVGSDNRQGGLIAAERFEALGRRRIVFLGDPHHAEIGAREAGLAEGLKSAGGSLVASRACGFTFAAGFDAVNALIAEGASFDGVFACNDHVAMGAVRALVDSGRRVPEDVSVIGYDDSPLAAAFVPPLTSVRQDWSAGGVLLARKVLAMIEGESVPSETLPTQLVVRAT